MLVQSTGLGKTVLTSVFSDFNTKEDMDGYPLQMKVEAIEPVHWYITIHLNGGDLRQMLKLALKPAFLGRALKLLIQGPPKLARNVSAEGQKSNI